MREYNVGAVYINNNVYAGETNIPLLKGNQGYSISRVVKTSGTGTPGSYDTYTIYINTDPESIVGTFQVWNGTGNIGDMTKAEYDTDNDGIVDNAERVNNHTVDIDVPSNAKFTDTVYDDTAITNRVTTLENAGYITKSVSDLVNYYTKTQTYTKAEVNALVDTIPKFSIEVVNSLPVTDISTTTIYLVRDDSSTGDIYKEYIYVNNTWEILGTQRVDLSNYYTKQETYNKTEVDTAISQAGGNEVLIGEEEDITPQTKILIEEVPEGSNIPYINSEVAIGSTNEDNRPVWFKQGKNIFNTNMTQGSIDNNTGNIVSTTQWAIASLDLIPVKPNTTYTFSCISSKTSVIDRIAYFNNSRAFISRSASLNANTFTIPQDTYFIRFSMISETISPSDVTNIQIEEGSTATTYEPYIRKAININGEDEYYTNDYSTEEQVIGKWIDGRTLYRKVIVYHPNSVIGSANTTTNISISHGISNFRRIVKASMVDETGVIFPTMTSSNGTNVTASSTILRVNFSDITFRIINDTWGPRDFYIILEYTKTTD